MYISEQRGEAGHVEHTEQKVQDHQRKRMAGPQKGLISRPLFLLPQRTQYLEAFQVLLPQTLGELLLKMLWNI